ncbi:MAG: hypothetical protein V1797_13900, partial [Pseudomonadota bacterium]
FSSWNLPKVNFGKFSEWRQKLIWRHSGRAVHGPPGSLSEDYSDRLLGQTRRVSALAEPHQD